MGNVLSKTLYRPEYCETIIDYGRAGMTKVEIASMYNVTATTLLKWCEQFPEFGEAYELAMTHAQAYWESIGRDNVVTTGDIKFNTPLYNRHMAVRFKADWNETQNINITTRTINDLLDELPD